MNARKILQLAGIKYEFYLIKDFTEIHEDFYTVTLEFSLKDFFTFHWLEGLNVNALEYHFDKIVIRGYVEKKDVRLFVNSINEGYLITLI